MRMILEIYKMFRIHKSLGRTKEVFIVWIFRRKLRTSYYILIRSMMY